MSESTYSVIHTIICDDVIREDNGKEILIGVYNESMIIDVLPALLPIFGMRFLIKTEKSEYENVEVKVVGPDGNEIVNAKGKIVVSNTKYPSSFFFKISPLVLPAAGKYEIHLGIDRSPEKVYTFEVLTREQVNSA